MIFDMDNNSTLTNKPPEITLFLTTPEAIMFRDFQQFHSTFALLCSSGVFDTRNGSCEIHFDNDGNIKKIERHNVLFDYRKENVL
jgi:hypothetical protein